ncbi:hypothetical protein HDV06_000044 [Boothiomyces sp. JEL0866]|nr:hypothetical protein HDV06_000044 [Boothiomyces sp. JEL0866]
MDQLGEIPLLIQEGTDHQSKYYPSNPYINRVKLVFQKWESIHTFPDFFQILFHLDLERNNEITKHFNDSTVDSSLNLYNKYDSYVKKLDYNYIAENLNFGEIKLLLGIRRTVGSVDTIFPPPLTDLLAAFQELHSNADTLTVGSRALSKHVHRSSSGWYGVNKYTGTRDEKNQIALELILRMIDNAVWLNVHSLPHNVYVLEIRVVEGYGARWTCIPEIKFRGFLEPMMEGGHERRWRHD